MTVHLDRLVRARAQECCEYCRLPQAYHPWRFEIDHVIAQQHQGHSDPENLALCCPRCNRHKGPNIAGVDPESRRIVPLFNPRTTSWHDHFEWNGPWLIRKTAEGRATIATLDINHPTRVAVRQTLIVEKVFPPV